MCPVLLGLGFEIEKVFLNFIFSPFRVGEIPLCFSEKDILVRHHNRTLSTDSVSAGPPPALCIIWRQVLQLISVKRVLGDGGTWCRGPHREDLFTLCSLTAYSMLLNHRWPELPEFSYL